MRFEDIPAGEARQLNGPWWGVRVLTVGDGAALRVDSLVVPVTVLVSYPAPRGIDRVEATGPIVLALADERGEDLAAMSASPAPPVQAAGWKEHVFNVAAGVLADSGALDCSDYTHALVTLDRGANVTAVGLRHADVRDDGTEIALGPTTATVTTNPLHASFGLAVAQPSTAIHAISPLPLPKRSRFYASAVLAAPCTLRVLLSARRA